MTLIGRLLRCSGSPAAAETLVVEPLGVVGTEPHRTTGQPLGISTAADGTFTLTVPTGAYRLVHSFSSYLFDVPPTELTTPVQITTLIRP